MQVAPRPRAVAAAARRQQQGGKGFGKAAPPKADAPQQAQQPPTAEQQQLQQVAAPTAAAPAQAASQGGSAAAATEQSTGGGLPAVSRGRIFAVCAQVSVLVATAGFVLRQVAPAISPAVKDGQGEAVEALLDCEWGKRWAVLASIAAASWLVMLGSMRAVSCASN